MKSTGVPAEQQKLFSEGLSRNKGVKAVCVFPHEKNQSSLKVWDQRFPRLFSWERGMLF